MNYEIIKDEAELNKFLKWLPNNKENEKYYICLFARKKYNPIVKSDKQCLKRVVAHKKHIVNKIRQMEIKLGTYNIDGVEVPNDSLVVYITTNPRDMERSCYNTSIDLIRLLQQGKIPNPKSVALNNIQKSGTKNSMIFDIDCKENFLENKSKLIDILGYSEYNFIETNGGYHLIVNFEKIKDNKGWYREIFKYFQVDQKGDLLSPVPGCIQGNFTAKFWSNK